MKKKERRVLLHTRRSALGQSPECIFLFQFLAPVRMALLTGASLFHHMTENKGNHYASHDLRGNVCEELT